MYLGAAPIWEAWTSGGPFVGELRANARVTVDPDWQLTLTEAYNHRGRGTWWRDNQETLSEFARATSWMIDSRKRRGARSFQQIRNGEWSYWGGGAGSEPITPPSGSTTRAQMAVFLKTAADNAKAAENPSGSVQALPTYDGVPDFPDISGESGATQAAIGQLAQASIILGYPDGKYRPSQIVSDSQKVAFVARLQDYLWGTTGAGRGVLELPNVQTVTWDRSIDTDAAECTIKLGNTEMKTNTGYQPDPNELGFPGIFAPNRGDSQDSVARWPNHSQNDWAGILQPNVLVRSYEGFGGQDLSIRAAVAAGQLRPTGTWLIDRVTISTDGTVTIQARDMARLLIEQFLMPPIVPQGVYPLRYMRYILTEDGQQRTGNALDYSDLIYDFLIWAGFYYDSFPATAQPQLGGGPAPEPGAAGFAQVHGVIETTGTFPEDGLPDDLFDKRPVMDAITEIRNAIGFLFWVGPEGECFFKAPNWYQPGNFDENMVHQAFVPEIDEKVQLTAYSVTLSGENLRSEIVIGSEAVPPVPPFGSAAETYADYRDALSRTTIYEPTEQRELLHGMHLPAMWINGAFSDPDEQEAMAQLIAMHIYYRGRQGSVTIVGNPNLSVDDQVRIIERQTSETYLHYIRGISSSLDNKTGVFTMTLTTHWLGDGNDWPAEQFSGMRIATLNPGS